MFQGWAYLEPQGRPSYAESRSRLGFAASCRQPGKRGLGFRVSGFRRLAETITETYDGNASQIDVEGNEGFPTVVVIFWGYLYDKAYSVCGNHQMLFASNP